MPFYRLPPVFGDVAALNTATALTDGATITIDCSLGSLFTVTLAGNRTIAVTNMTTGQIIDILVKQDGTGSRTLTWPTTTSGSVTLTTAATKTDWCRLIKTGAATYIVSAPVQNI